MELSSTFRKALHVQLYAAAASIAHHKFTITPDRTPNELTTWTSLDQPAVTLPAFGKRTARVTIRVPATAPEGERYAVIWAQVTARPDAKHNIGVVNRVGIPIYLDIGPGGEQASDLRIEKLTPARAEDGRPRLVAQVHNTGGRALDVSGTLWLSDGPGGLPGRPVRRHARRHAPSRRHRAGDGGAGQADTERPVEGTADAPERHGQPDGIGHRHVPGEGHRHGDHPVLELRVRGARRWPASSSWWAACRCSCFAGGRGKVRPPALPAGGPRSHSM